ncbi:MAG: 16S rRNA (cytosine(1402)-N(4))-methyltransferase RsmH [Alphaproteobacteria bacterium]
MSKDARHAPVQVHDVLKVIAPQRGDVILDATFGWGGYTRCFLEAAQCTVVAIDRDPTARVRAKALAEEFPGRLEFFVGPFGDMEALVSPTHPAFQGIAFDIGVSSMQLDDVERGFSFQQDGPLDMRMSADADPSIRSAADVVNEETQDDLANIIWRYGEERKSRRIAHAIVDARAEKPITRTLQLANIVARAAGGRGAAKVHPATRTFQALRIYVNDELGQLEAGLHAAERMLAPEGRLAVVSFHSLEDRIVKDFLRERGGLAPTHSRHLPQAPNRRPPSFRLASRKAIKPSDEEVARNPRARSARLRAAVRTEHPAWPQDTQQVR